MVADVAVVLLDREGQVLAREQSILRDQPVEALPIVRQEDVALDADPAEQSPAGALTTPPPPLVRSRRQVPSSRPPSSQARVRRATGSKARQSQTLFFYRSRSAPSRRSARPRSTARPRAPARPRRPRAATCRP